MEIGDKVKNFKVKSSDGEIFNLKDKEGQVIVLYFYPKDDTPGCTIESNEFNKLLPKFKKMNVEVYGVSRDDLKSHDKFINKFELKFSLLADTESAVCDLFDVIKDKNMYGKMVKGIERSTFIINEDGELVKEWRKVKAEGHAQEVLDYIKEFIA